MKPLEKAIASLGSQAELAKRLGKKRSTINSWVKGRNKIPAEVAVEIEGLRIGVSRKDLRPDLWG
ncbi:YdaS family helix-turn-helix protein [Eikenella corrodens]|uniref:transcriptional regulator n=1 Tax=Eikenella corrodens TaxID=539 RepID=UPI0028E8543D|nr:YdaS family helix-turn-helix protein [Eikenella corrodens]